MKREYDLRKGKRGSIGTEAAGKTRISIPIDGDVLDWFRGQVDAAGGGNYQRLINIALREHVFRREPLEATLRRVLREELTQGSVSTGSSLRRRMDEENEYLQAMKRQRRMIKNAKSHGLAGRPTWTRDELHERHSQKKAK